MCVCVCVGRESDSEITIGDYGKVTIGDYETVPGDPETKFQIPLYPTTSPER